MNCVKCSSDQVGITEHTQRLMKVKYVDEQLEVVADVEYGQSNTEYSLYGHGSGRLYYSLKCAACGHTMIVSSKKKVEVGSSRREIWKVQVVVEGCVLHSEEFTSKEEATIRGTYLFEMTKLKRTGENVTLNVWR